MRIWIDFDNSPHVHFFAPMIRELQRCGLEIMVTVRSFGQTEELAQSYGIPYTLIGEHRTPKLFLTRVTATGGRALKLALFARSKRPDVAISHGSRALALAAWTLRIPSMTIYDYEFVSSKFFSKVSQKIMVPDVISLERLQRQGVDTAKVLRYPGFKEEAYIYDLPRSANVMQQLGLDASRLIITVRPPATWAHYHNPKSEILFHALIERLQQEPDAQVIVLPRMKQQGDQLKAEYGMDKPPFRVQDKAVDALSLMTYSDAVFSGGGTMIREAALLGMNAYSIFAGTAGAADQALEKAGRLHILREPEQVKDLQFSKSPTQSLASNGKRTTRDFLLHQMLDFCRRNGNVPASVSN
jgi:predicted glycosyltransferase